MSQDQLRVSSQNPFQELTTKTRIRQLLHTHQGRDKLFKVLQYALRLKLWCMGIDINPSYVVDHEGSVTDVERNLMTTMNTRRLFRVGRFVGEFVRMHVTLIKCSELLYYSTATKSRQLFLQVQMIADIIARFLMLVKSVCEDVAFLAQKGFLHANVADALLRVSAKCALPVLTVDFALNTLRLAQGVLEATRIVEPRTPSDYCASEEVGVTNHESSSGKKVSMARSDRSFSLLSEYDTVDKIRRRTSGASTNVPSTAGTPPPSSPNMSHQDLMPVLKCSRDDFDPLDEGGNSGRTATPTDPSNASNNLLDDCGECEGHHANQKLLEDDTTVVVHSYPMLFWADFELHWTFVTELKLVLDIFVALSVLQRWSAWKGAVSIAGFASGLLSVYRVWTYGR